MVAGVLCCCWPVVTVDAATTAAIAAVVAASALAMGQFVPRLALLMLLMLSQLPPLFLEVCDGWV